MVAELIPVSLHPDEPTVWSKSILSHTKKADRLFDSGLLEEAAREYENALSITPDDAYLHNNRGAVLAALGRQDEALRNFKRAVKLNPKNPIMLRNQAFVLAELGRTEEALRTLECFKHPISQEARRPILDLHLKRLVESGFASWSGEKPKGSKNPVKLTPGPPVSDDIVEERQRLRGV